MEGLTEGRIVHYVLSNGQHRAAIVVRVFEPYGKEAYLALDRESINEASRISRKISCT